MPLSAYALDHFIAPKLSLLNACNAPDVPAMPNYYEILVLNQMLQPMTYTEPLKVLLLNFVRRLGSATTEYRSGRDNLLLYLSKLPQHRDLEDYHRALAHFEDCVLNGHIAAVCLAGVGTYLRSINPAMPDVLKRGADYDRLRCLSNRIKHFGEDVEKAVRRSATMPVAPMWITNDGLEAQRRGARSADGIVALRFNELSDILTMQAKVAKAFAEDFFAQAEARRKQQQSASE
jgi:hypothetical protein